MARPHHLTAAQLELMNLFWEHEELGVADAWRLLLKRRAVARNTVQTTLSRLVDRGLLRARVDGNAHYFRAAQPRETVVRGILGQLVETVFAGSTSRLIATLLANRRVSPAEAARIRQLIKRAERDER